ncbi:uncharacterized protein LOC115209763 [Octopus sinensis]|uniref:Uncharacterized protein LOC115209763 n=1 Tax=Octopus sinensis TaxID=2607531 RepID=A0A6P7S7Q5_9MOLL|nr:uncharacterized protein LOC115209763 [Octopus sinensis]
MIETGIFVATFIAVVSSLAPPPPEGYVYVLPQRNLTNIGKRTSFRYNYITQSGNCYPYKPSDTSIAIAATNNVIDKALTVACHTLAKITKNMPREVFVSTSKSSGVGIFTMDETLTVYPQNSALADRPECYNKCGGQCRNTCTFDGRKYAMVPGMTNSISLSNMESVLCMPRDIYRGTESILTHEFAHLVHIYMEQKWKNKIKAAYDNARNGQLWRMNSYSMANEYEYFAVASESFFHNIIRTDTITTGGMNLCGGAQVCSSERIARDFLKKHDPMVYEALVYAYTNNRVDIMSNLKACEK